VGVAKMAVEVAKDSLDTEEADAISPTEVITEADVEPAEIDDSLVEEKGADGKGAFVVV
jgi:hypothetical protein